MLDMSKDIVREQMLCELMILEKCSSPFIIGFFGHFGPYKEISICMEFMV